MKALKLFCASHFYFFLLGLLFFQNSDAQSVPQKLDSLFQAVLDSMRTELNVKGLSAAVDLHNDAVWTGGSGISSQNPVDNISSDHVFAIGSTTKTITAACILQLRDEGLLSLEDSLHQWVQPFEHVNDHITIRQLLQHTSGIYDLFQHPNFQQQMNFQPLTIWEPETVLNTFLLPPPFAPGTSWGYSSSNYLLLGLIIEAATGMEYHEAIRERFLTPLALESFSLFPYEPYNGTLTHLWLDLNGNGTPTDAHSYFSMLRSSFSAGWAAGAYYANSADLARWIKDFFTEGLFEPETLEDAMTTIPTAFPAGSRYGLGIIRRSFLGLHAFGHGGDIGFSANAFYFPDKNISISVNCNDGTANSWEISVVIPALLRAYLDCEALVTGTKEVTEDATVHVAPNPVKNHLTITIESLNASQVEGFIYNLQGQLVEAFQIDVNGKQQVHLDCRAWPGGTYFYRLKSSHTTIDSGMIVKM